MLATLAAAAFTFFCATAGKASAAEIAVLRVGDSVSKLTTPYILGPLSDVQVFNWDVAGSNPAGVTSSVALVNLKHSYTPEYQVVGFDAGSNDPPRRPQVLAHNLRQAGKVIGNSCLVVPTLEPPEEKGESSNARNAAIFDFAISRPRTLVPEWGGVVEMEPKMWLSPVGLVAKGDAAKYRAQMMAASIHKCVAIVEGKTEPRAKPVWLHPVDRVQRALAAS